MEYKEIKIDNKTYLVSSGGEIYRKLAPFSARGYQKVTLGDKKYFIHRLVAKLFIPNPDNLPIVNHKDKNVSNNNVENLEWCTSEYNSNYGKIKIPNDTESKLKPVVQCHKYNHEPINIFDNALKAAKSLNKNDDAAYRIIQVCKDIENLHHHSACGYWWRFATSKELKEIKTKSTS